MLPLIFTAAALYADPSPLAVPIDLDTIKAEDAALLEGRLVRNTCTITCPPDTHSNLTVVGTGWDAVERTAFLRKDLLVDKGDEVTVVGVLSALRYRPSVVKRIFIPPCVEVRVSPAWRVWAGDR